MGRTLRNGAFVAALIATVALTTNVPSLVRERSRRANEAVREHVPPETREALRKLRGD